MKHILVSLLLIVTASAYAGGRHEPRRDNQTPPGAEQRQAQGQAQGQNQSSRNDNRSENRNDNRSSAQQAQIGINVNENQSGASSHSGSNSNSSSNSNSGGNTLSVEGGQHSASSESAGGSAEAGGGNAVNEIGIDNSRDYAASSAASVYAGYCQVGGSGQVESGGFSIVNGDQFCEHIRMADRALLAAIQAREDRDQLNYDHYMDVYHENLAEAESLLDNTQVTGLIQRWANQLSIPIALLAVLFII
jgi:hypothetical protein